MPYRRPHLSSDGAVRRSLMDIMGQNKYLFQVFKIRRRRQQRIFGYAGFVKAGIGHIAQNQIPGIERGTGGDHLLLVPDDGIRRQIVHTEHSLGAPVV